MRALLIPRYHTLTSRANAALSKKSATLSPRSCRSYALITKRLVRVCVVETDQGIGQAR